MEWCEDKKYDIVTVEVKKTGLNSKKIRNKLLSIKKTTKGALKLVTFPANTMTAIKMEKVLDEMVVDGFVPDVIVVDYADIIMSEKNREHRHDINDKWLSLRSLAQKKHCAVITGSHTAKTTFKKDEFHLADSRS